MLCIDDVILLDNGHVILFLLFQDYSLKTELVYIIDNLDLRKISYN